MATVHHWDYLKPTLLGEDQVTISEAELLLLIKQGSIKTSTKLCSVTRTKGQWTTAGSIPALIKLIEQSDQQRAQQKLELVKAKAQAKADIAIAKVNAKTESAQAKAQQAAAEADLARMQAINFSSSSASVATVNALPPIKQFDSEHVIETFSPSMFRQSPVRFVITIASCFLIIGIPYLLLWFLQCKATKLTLTNKKSILRHGIFSKLECEVWHRDVRQVVISQGVFQRIMGVGNVGISSASSSGFEIFINGIASPATVKEIVNKFR